LSFPFELAHLIRYNFRVPFLYEKILIAVLLAVLCGEVAVFCLKRYFADPSLEYSPDISGMIERSALVIAINLGGNLVYFIPLIIIIRAFFLAGGNGMRGFSELIKRDEPAVQFQKIRLKSELSVSLLASPAIGIIFGLIAIFL
jgi:predicted small secreted protein